MSAELKPCPFCGSSGKLSRIISAEGERRGEKPSFDIDCTGCGLWWRFGTEAEAVAAWNRRAMLAAAPPPPEPQSDLVGVLREALKGLQDQLTTASGMNIAIYPSDLLPPIRAAFALTEGREREDGSSVDESGVSPAGRTEAQPSAGGENH